MTLKELDDIILAWLTDKPQDENITNLSQTILHKIYGKPNAEECTVQVGGMKYWYEHRVAHNGETCLGTQDPNRYCNGIYKYSSKDPGSGMAFVVTQRENVYDLRTLLDLKFVFNLYSDSSSMCLGYKRMCKIITELEKQQE